jgi:hypothetical protein
MKYKYNQWNKVEDFYRKKEIISIIREYTYPLNVNINEEKETVEIGFQSEIGAKLTKGEKVYLLNIMANINYNFTILLGALKNKLEVELEEIREEIKKDFNILGGK